MKSSPMGRRVGLHAKFELTSFLRFSRTTLSGDFPLESKSSLPLLLVLGCSSCLTLLVGSLKKVDTRKLLPLFRFVVAARPSSQLPSEAFLRIISTAPTRKISRSRRRSTGIRGDRYVFSSLVPRVGGSACASRFWGERRRRDPLPHRLPSPATSLKLSQRVFDFLNRYDLSRLLTSSLLRLA